MPKIPTYDEGRVSPTTSGAKTVSYGLAEYQKKPYDTLADALAVVSQNLV